MDYISNSITIVSILITGISVMITLRTRKENKKLKKIGNLREWLNTNELDQIQATIWSDFNKNGGIIYDTKIFSTDYPASREYALTTISENRDFQFTRILTLETKNKRETARLLFSKNNTLLKTRQRIELYHNFELTEIYLSTNQIVPEPTYNFLINQNHHAEQEAIFSWSKTDQITPVAGFQIFDEKVIDKLELSHQTLINKCEKISSIDYIDSYANKEYDLIKRRFSIIYEKRPDIYDKFAIKQIYNSNLFDLVKEEIRNLKRDNLNIIDIGCGTGIIIEKLSKEFSNCNFIGIDPAQAMLDFAINRCKNCLNVKFECKGVESFENSNEQFDIVISTWGFFNWIEKAGILEKITKTNGATILVNNWGSDDDFHNLWPEPAIRFFIDRRTKYANRDYRLKHIDSIINLKSDKTVYESMSEIFGKYTMTNYIKDDFKIKFVLAVKIKN